MKKSAYRSIFHIYSIFFLSLLGTVVVAFILIVMLITVQKSDGETVKSDWAKIFTEEFKEQIVFIDGTPQLTQTGITMLQDNRIGLQILNDAGNEIFAFNRPENACISYSYTDLLNLGQTGRCREGEITSFVGGAAYENNSYVYIVHFPLQIRKVTMYLNGKRFSGGKTVILITAGMLLLVISVGGIVYGFWMAKIIDRLAAAIQNISKRSYIPLVYRGAFGDLVKSLNDLDIEIKASDRLREETETMRSEWIANITHDLKTPLSPIKGYIEILLNGSSQEDERLKRHAKIILKNVAYMENLIDDMKLTYQLKNCMLPVVRQEQNIVRFLRELVIDILNSPKYENRRIQFDSTEETISLSFDAKLLTRAFQNLIINSFEHGNENTKVELQISVSGNMVNVSVTDDGNGMTNEETDRLFERYYRGTYAENKHEGTGLGLAIVKDVVELHNGTITVSSILGVGTSFVISFPTIKVN